MSAPAPLPIQANDLRAAATAARKFADAAQGVSGFHLIHAAQFLAIRNNSTFKALAKCTNARAAGILVERLREDADFVAAFDSVSALLVATLSPT